MRTTVSLDPDVLAAVQHLRASTGVRLSDAVNQLVRQAVVAAARSRKPFEHGLAVCNADSDFGRFPVRVVNPLAA